MTSEVFKKYKIGWIGMGRMGYPMAERLVKAGCDITVWNRTRSKAEPLAELGATIVDNKVDLAGLDVVFTMVSTSDDLKQVLFDEGGVLSSKATPKIFVDCSSVSVEASAEIRARLAQRGAHFIASPVSGNGKCVKAGKLSIVTSGPEGVYQEVKPFLEVIGGMGVTYVGEGELSRIVKICHNVFLGVVTQSMAELTILAEKSGVSRQAFMGFINQSVMGSVFTKYKTPGWVNLNFATTFTPELMRKDMDLGLSMGRTQEVPMPVASITRDIMQASIGHGNKGDIDFGIVVDYMAKSSGLELESEGVEVDDGLSD
ncbi:MAG: NAD(P)-dependent oxidoreductase [Spongiibacteraceae bacterium]|nr:NAD(P)-dependent oxidoreductase [Spongiibacteraceae bacterium]